MKITIGKLAELANVSQATISRALNNKPEVNGKTKKRITDLAEKVGYEPNIMARGLKTKQTHSLGLIITNITNPYFAELTEAVEEEAAKKGFHTLLCISGNKIQKEAEYVRLLREERVDGMLIVHPGDESRLVHLDYILELKRRNFPFVIFGDMGELEVNYVTHNDELGAYKLISHLADLGHTKIGFIHEEPMSGSTQARIRGYIKALAEHDIFIVNDLLVKIKKNDPGIGAVREATRKVLGRKDRPSALVGFNDFTAFGILQAVREYGLEVPDDIAVVGFDNIELISSLDIPLTTVAFPVDIMAETAVNLVLEKIRAHNKGKISQIILEPKLIIRKSSGDDKGRSKV